MNKIHVFLGPTLMPDPFTLPERLGEGSSDSAEPGFFARSRRYCVITIAAVRVSGIVTDDTRLVSGG